MASASRRSYHTRSRERTYSATKHYDANAFNKIWKQYVTMSAAYNKSINESYIDVTGARSETYRFDASSAYFKNFSLKGFAEHSSTFSRVSGFGQTDSVGASVGHNRPLFKGSLSLSLYYAPRHWYTKKFYNNLNWQAAFNVTQKKISESDKDVTSFTNTLTYPLRAWLLGLEQKNSYTVENTTETKEASILFRVTRVFCEDMVMTSDRPGNLPTDTSSLPSIALAAVVVALAFISFNRNSVWKSPETLWADVVAKSPSKARPHYNYATVLAGNGELDCALEENLKAIEIYPYYGKAYFNIGAIFHTWGRVDEAIYKYEIALALKPDIVEAHNNLGYAYYTKGRYPEALKEYRTALGIRPSHVKARINLGYLYRDTGMLDEAIDEYRTALKYMPDYADAYRLIGEAYLLKKDPAAAIENLKRAVELAPYSAEAHNGLGRAFEISGEPRLAGAEYEKALRLNPGLEEAGESLRRLNGAL